MSNQLMIPFKTSSPPELASALNAHIAAHHPGTLPDAFDWDIHRWETLRSAVSSGDVHGAVVDDFLKYHAQLVLLLTKLPVEIDLPISYHHAFQTTAGPVTLPNLAYERVCVLFNLAALLSQLAESENRTSVEGIKRASGYYQNAAGTFAYILQTALPPFLASLTQPLPSNDLANPVLKSLEYLMLAQAQECYWQKAVLDGYRNGTIARLSMQVSVLYGSALNAIQLASPPVGNVFPPTWLAHFQTKQLHFEAAAQFRKSMDDSENSRHGVELARLASARSFARKGIEIARRGVANTVLDDVNTLSRFVDEQITKSQRDNDYIYHHDVPAVTSLEAIEPAQLVASVTLGGLKEPQAALSGEDPLLIDLTSWGARMAIGIYQDRKVNSVANLRQRVQELDRAVSGKLQELNLPASLDVLERPVDLPPTLLSRSEELRASGGTSYIRRLVRDLELLAQQDREILEEAYEALDMEVEEDEEYRKANPDANWGRDPSETANVEFVDRAKKYSDVLGQASESDKLLKEKWDKCCQAVEQLASDEETLDSLIPSGTLHSPHIPLSNIGKKSQSISRLLRKSLETLDELRRSRQQFLSRAQNVASSDDITGRIKLAAVGLERWTQVKAEMFEDVIGEELGKYEVFRGEIEKSATKQAELLQRIEDDNEDLLRSRREDPSVKDRERMLQNFSFAYQEYHEIIKNLKDGSRFYNEFAQHLADFRDACKNWAYQRRTEIQSMIRTVAKEPILETPQHQPSSPPPLIGDESPRSPTLSPTGSPHADSPPSSPPPSSPPSIDPKRRGSTPRTNQPLVASLPPPDSDEWQPIMTPSSAMPIPIPRNTTSPISRGGSVGSKPPRASKHQRESSQNMMNIYTGGGVGSVGSGGSAGSGSPLVGVGNIPGTGFMKSVKNKRASGERHVF